MALALSAGDWIERAELPEPAAFDAAEDWVDALFAGESGRGPHHDAEPSASYGFLWALWLSAVPYGLWSERVSAPSMAEHVQWVAKLEGALAAALEHFGVALRDDTTVNDLACACASLVEGVWLNQCLTSRHPFRAAEPIADVLRRGGRLLWRGATLPA